METKRMGNKIAEARKSKNQSQAQLAEHLGISLSGAKSRIQRARRRLREGLERGCRVCFDDEGRVIGFTPRPPLHD